MKKSDKKVNKLVFWPPAILICIILLVGAFMPDALANLVSTCLNWVTYHFTWFYALGATLLVFFCLFVCFSKYGKIRIGGKDAKPEIGFWKWFCIVLTSGMGSGICYWCVAEPLNFFQNAPVFAGYASSSVEAMENSLKYVFLHWTLHPYAAYTAIGVCIIFLYWNCKKPFSLSTALIPLLGDKRTAKLRYWIDALCIFCLVAGLGTTMGLSIDQMSGGLNYLGLDIDRNTIALTVSLVFGGIAILAACTGLHKGISAISTTNMYIFIALMVFALFFGGTHFILNNTVTGIGKFLDNFIHQSFYTEPGYESGWVGGWTIFYWGWWIAFAPLIGLFQVKLSKGRTVREYILVNMLVPCLFLIAWMGIFGSSAMKMEFDGNHVISNAVAEYGSAVAFFAYLKNLPLTPITTVVAFAAVIFSLITMTEAEILTLADMSVATENDLAASDNFAPTWVKVFWGICMSLIGFVLLYSGGLNAVQTVSIVLGFPILILMLVMCVSALKGFKNYKELDVTLKPGEDYDE